MVNGFTVSLILGPKQKGTGKGLGRSEYHRSWETLQERPARKCQMLWTQVRGESCLGGMRLHWPGLAHCHSRHHDTMWQNAAPIYG